MKHACQKVRRAGKMVAGCKFYVCGKFFRARWPFIEKDKENDFIFPLKMRTTGFKKLCVGPFSIEIGGNLKRKGRKKMRRG